MTYSNNTSNISNFLYTLEPNGIERQEAHQQQIFTNNCDLPIKCDDWAKLEEWGVIKGEQTDPLFDGGTLEMTPNSFYRLDDLT